MREITKGDEPALLTAWKRANPHARYPALSNEQRRAIRTSCITEQFGLCAYCCQSIDVDTAHNEHIEAQDTAPNRTLDCSNIVASCQTPNQCGHGRGTQFLPLTPLMAECETELKFYLSGRVEGLTERAKTSISALNLGDTLESNRGLIGKRKALVEAILFSELLDPAGLVAEDDDLLAMLMDNLLTPDDDQRLQAFSPVLVNVIRHYLART